MEPGKTVQPPIKIIRWKHNGNLVANWNSPDKFTYYGQFKGRTTLDAETLKLKIKDLTLSDSGTFSLETEKGPVNSYEVKVISKYVYAGVWVSVGGMGTISWPESPKKWVYLILMSNNKSLE